MPARPSRSGAGSDSNSFPTFDTEQTEQSERVQSSSCSAIATAGTPSSPRSIRSGVSSVSHMGLPLVQGALGNSFGLTAASDLSIQCSIIGGGPYSPPSRLLHVAKRPSSALSEGSLYSSAVAAVGDSLPRDDELTTIDDEDSCNQSGYGGQIEDSVEMRLTNQTTPVQSVRKCEEDSMGGRKGFESANYVENLDELGDFQVRVESQDFHFSCGHFVAYEGYRERLHGHTYTVKMRIGGRLNPDGYVVDFNLCKRVVRETCKKFTEYMIIPMKSDVLTIRTDSTSVYITTQDGARFMFPQTDCLCLPIMHSTAEELAAHFWNEALQAFSPKFLQDRGVRWLEITVAERATQEAQYRRHIPVPPPL